MSLLNLLPVYFKNIKDFEWLTRTEDISFDEANESLNQLVRNFFIETCDEQTLSAHEKLLSIRVSPQDTLDFRRRKLLSRYNSIIPYTLPSLKEKLEVLCGIDNYTIIITNDPNAAVQPNHFLVQIEINDGSYGIIDEVNYLLDTVLPAHLIRKLSQVLKYYLEAYNRIASAIMPSMIYSLTSDIHAKYTFSDSLTVASGYSAAMSYSLF